MGSIALFLTALPIALYGPSIYVHLVHAVLTDNHSYDLDDISLMGLFTRAGHRQIGALASLLVPWILFFAIRRRRGADPITLGGIAACAAILCSPLGWYEFLVVAYPCLAVARRSRFAGIGAVLMFVENRAAVLTGRGFVGLSGSVQFAIATSLFLVAFWKAMPESGQALQRRVADSAPAEQVVQNIVGGI